MSNNNDGDTIITAKLVRGKLYTYLHEGVYYEFKRAVPRTISDSLADALEDITEVVTTSDGDEIEKEVFHVDRNAPARDDEEEAHAPKRLRMRIVPVDEAPRRLRKPTAPPARVPPKGLTQGRRGG